MQVYCSECKATKEAGKERRQNGSEGMSAKNGSRQWNCSQEGPDISGRLRRLLNWIDVSDWWCRGRSEG